MTYAELIFELKRLAELAGDVSWDIQQDLVNLINEHDIPKGDCCG